MWNNAKFSSLSTALVPRSMFRERAPVWRPKWKDRGRRWRCRATSMPMLRIASNTTVANSAPRASWVRYCRVRKSECARTNPSTDVPSGLNACAMMAGSVDRESTMPLNQYGTTMPKNFVAKTQPTANVVCSLSLIAPGWPFLGQRMRLIRKNSCQCDRVLFLCAAAVADAEARCLYPRACFAAAKRGALCAWSALPKHCRW
eukprot:gene22774-biopygen23112